MAHVCVEGEPNSEEDSCRRIEQYITLQNYHFFLFVPFHRSVYSEVYWETFRTLWANTNFFPFSSFLLCCLAIQKMSEKLIRMYGRDH